MDIPLNETIGPEEYLFFSTFKLQICPFLLFCIVYVYTPVRAQIIQLFIRMIAPIIEYFAINFMIMHNITTKKLNIYYRVTSNN